MNACWVPCKTAPTAPWGTYLTCEENWSDIFTNPGGNISALEKRYGIGKSEDGYRWSEVDERFNSEKNPNEPNRFGWVVEMRPVQPQIHAAQTHRTGALQARRCQSDHCPPTAAWLCIWVMINALNTFINSLSKNRYQPGNRAANMRLLEEGTLYAARFNENGSGDWLALVHGQNGLTAANGFADQGEVLVKTRMAADLVGATKDECPGSGSPQTLSPPAAFIAPSPTTASAARGKPAADAIIPRANNLFGHIIHWQEADGDGTKLSFKWDILVLAGNKQATKSEHKGNINGDDFGSGNLALTAAAYCGFKPMCPPPRST